MNQYPSDHPGQQSRRQNMATANATANAGPLRLKTYRAWTMAEALATVKADLGGDAVILHTRTFERGGFFGFGRRTVVELTAARAADMPAEPAVAARAATASRAPAVEPKESVRMSAAARAYGAQPASVAATGAAGLASRGPADPRSTEPESFDLESERAKTRRLAQAMAIQLEKQASAREAASQNERATIQSSAASPAVAPPTPGAPSAVASSAFSAGASRKPATPNAAAPTPTPSSASPTGRLPSHPLPSSEPVAQRFVLVAQPSAAGAKPGLVAQLATAVPKPAATTVVPTPAAPVPAPAPVVSVAPAAAAVASPALTHAAQPAAAPVAAFQSTAFISPISIDPWCGGATEDRSDEAPAISAKPADAAAPAISIAAPIASAELVAAARPSASVPPARASDELSAISEFVGRMLETRAHTAPREQPAEPIVAEPIAAEPTVAKPTVVIEPRSAAEPVSRITRTAVRDAAPTSAAARAEVLERAYAQLIEQEVAAQLAERIVESVAAEMQAAFDAGAEPSEQVVRAAIERHIAAILPADAEDGLGASARILPGKFGARRIAFIGPTGVGKTTTLAKVAAQLKLKRGLSVGIVAADTYRIAAVDQLRTYADILEVPVEVAASPADAERACEQLAAEHGVDVILIDTAGRSQNDRMKLSELRAFLNAAQPDETHLVLSATASARTLEREATAFGAVGIDRIVLTKLDEAATFGTLISLVERLGKRVSFLTHGQEVPDHIELGRGRRLAALVMGSEVR